ncbi:hypothetical protein HJC23_000758 [Cyclotella cryptica]|uniref:Uncharacterized protein n=1 Tax=Cyclotella cryptica TaxID=29204 RepID=A0ABD3Q0S3_9STRA
MRAGDASVLFRDAGGGGGELLEGLLGGGGSLFCLSLFDAGEYFDHDNFRCRRGNTSIMANTVATPDPPRSPSPQHHPRPSSRLVWSDSLNCQRNCTVSTMQFLIHVDHHAYKWESWDFGEGNKVESSRINEFVDLNRCVVCITSCTLAGVGAGVPVCKDNSEKTGSSVITKDRESTDTQMEEDVFHEEQYFWELDRLLAGHRGHPCPYPFCLLEQDKMPLPVLLLSLKVKSYRQSNQFHECELELCRQHCAKSNRKKAPKARVDTTSPSMNLESSNPFSTIARRPLPLQPQAPTPPSHNYEPDESKVWRAYVAQQHFSNRGQWWTTGKLRVLKRWGLTLIVGVCRAMIATTCNIASRRLGSVKFDHVYDLLEARAWVRSRGGATGTGGDGIPDQEQEGSETLSPLDEYWFNLGGSPFWRFCFSVAAGLPMGKEGPMFSGVAAWAAWSPPDRCRRSRRLLGRPPKSYYHLSCKLRQVTTSKVVSDDRVTTAKVVVTTPLRQPKSSVTTLLRQPKSLVTNWLRPFVVRSRIADDSKGPTDDN